MYLELSQDLGPAPGGRHPRYIFEDARGASGAVAVEPCRRPSMRASPLLTLRSKTRARADKGSLAVKKTKES